EYDVVPVHEGGVDVPVVRHDLDLWVELPAALAGTQRYLRAPGRTVIARTGQRHPRRRAVALARLGDAVPGRHHVRPRVVRIRRDGRLPIVGLAIDDVFARPAPCGGNLERRRVDAERAVGLRLGDRLESLVGGFGLLGGLGVPDLALLDTGFLGGGFFARRFGRWVLGGGRGGRRRRLPVRPHDDDEEHERGDD